MGLLVEKILDERGYARCHFPAWTCLAAGDGQNVANWIEVFTPVRANQAWPTEWPKVLIIDSRAFTRGGKNERRFNVLGAVGIEDAEPWRWAPTKKVWKVAPSAKKDTDA